MKATAVKLDGADVVDGVTEVGAQGQTFDTGNPDKSEFGFWSFRLVL